MSNTALCDSDSEPAHSRYGDSDDDGESLVDVDSPADGYFERRDHPQTTYMPNPAVQPTETSEEDKAREAAAERRRAAAQESGSAVDRNGGRERPPSHHSGSRSPVWGAANENTPLLDAGPAGPPPDYAAATADRRERGHGREGSYGSLSDSAFSSDHPLVRNGLMNEQGVFGSRAQPQSMQDATLGLGSPSRARGGSGLRGGGTEDEGGNGGEGDEERGFVRRDWDRDWNGRRRWTGHFKSKKIGRWIAVLGIVVLILFVSGVFEDAQENGKYPSGGNGRNQPEKSPERGGDGGDDGGRDEGNNPTEDSPMPPHRSTTQCPYHSFSTPKQYPFDSPSNFTFLELIEGATERGFFNDQISGTLRVAPGPPNQKSAIVLWISVAVSGPWRVDRLRGVYDSESFEVMFPQVTGDVQWTDEPQSASGRWKSAKRSCLDISVGMLVRPGTDLGTLEVNTANLDVQIEHGVFDVEEDRALEDDTTGPGFEAVESTSITAVRGKVDARYLSSRTTYVQTHSSSIHGTFALRDLLVVKSDSGQIGIDVDPKDADEKDPQPAEFHASSHSGNITVEYLTDSADLPDRDYRARIETSSSAVKGTYILGSHATFDTNSGSLDVDVLPYSADKQSTLHTSSGSAQTKLRVSPPYTASSTKVLSHLTSSHKSFSGALHLTYPDEWEGVIDGESISGGIKIRGEDVVMLVDQEIPGPNGKTVLKHVAARKGYGESRIGFKTGSGGVDVLVGRE